MLEGLLEYEDYCKNNVGVYSLLEEKWKKIHDIVKALNPVYATTIKLQGRQLLLVRESLILNNDIINAAVLLNLRLKRLLSVEKKAAAKKHLKNIAKQMLLFHQKEKTIDASNMIERQDSSSNETIDVTTDLPSSSGNSSLSLQSASSILLRNSIVEMELDCTDEEKENTDIVELKEWFDEIDNYKEKHVDTDANLIEYWEQKKYSVPYLAKLAKIIHAVPATQVSVERNFSALFTVE